jgi:hypothetical protein
MAHLEFDIYPFQVTPWSSHAILFKIIWSHVLPFKSPIVQSYSQMQFSLMDQLHEKKIPSLLANAPLGVTWTHLCYCVGPAIGAWLLACLNTPSFCLSSTHFFTTLHIHFDILHPMVIDLFVWSYHQWFVYSCAMLPMWMNTLQPMIRFKIPLQLLCWKMEFTTERDFPAFPPPYTETNGYCHH